MKKGDFKEMQVLEKRACWVYHEEQVTFPSNPAFLSVPLRDDFSRIFGQWHFSQVDSRNLKEKPLKVLELQNKY